MGTGKGRIFEFSDFRDRTGIFNDREHAGQYLSEILVSYKESDAVIFAIPAGGVPVAFPLSYELGLTLDVAVVSKITLPWNTEMGYGAVAFDGTVLLNEELISRIGLSEKEIQEGIEKTKEKVFRRTKEFRKGDISSPKGKTVILVDDGLASGFTMRTAVEAVRNAGAEKVIAAVPTGSLHAVDEIALNVEEIYCLNIRTGQHFAVADAYKLWSDVSDEEVIKKISASR